MASVLLGNLGTTPGNEELSVAGNLYVFLTDTDREALVLDLRTYERKLHAPISRPAFRTIKPFKFPILPPPILGTYTKEIEIDPRISQDTRERLKKVARVYVVELCDQPSSYHGWRYLSKLFPTAASNGWISKVLPGKFQPPFRNDQRTQRIIDAIESTDLISRNTLAEAGPFKVFAFRNQEGGTGSVLVSGDILEQSFHFAFFTKPSFSEFFSNGIDLRDVKLHLLSCAEWHIFIPQLPCACQTSP